VDELTITLHDRKVWLTGPAGSAKVFFRNPCTPEHVETLRWLLEDSSLAIGPEHRRRTEAVAAVDDLAVALFRALSATPRSAALLQPVVEFPELYAVRVVSDDAGFLALPWELLRPPDDTAVSLAWVRELVRRPATREHGGRAAEIRPATGPLRVLLVSPRPLGAADVRPRTVHGPLLQAAELADGAVEVNLLRPATFERLRAVLADGDGYDILHFDGHGYAEAGTAGTSGVVFEDEEGRARPVSADEFADSVLAARIPLIVLNACRSAYHEASADGGTMGGSVAAALLNAGAGSVLAMTHTVDAPVVATFMTAFYDALVRGDTVATAVSYGRWALLADSPFHLIPVLYEQHAVELRTPAGSPPGSPAAPHHPEPASVLSLMYLDEELAEIDRQLHDGSPVVVHGPVLSGKSVLLRAYARYALLTRGFDHVEVIADEQLATDESLLLRRVRDNARAFAGRPVLHVWDGVDQYLDSCAEATRALPAEHRVLMSARLVHAATLRPRHPYSAR
jgi:CHAT domain